MRKQHMRIGGEPAIISDCKMYLKIHKKQGEAVVAACDRELLGKTLSEGEMEFEVLEKFYGGDLADISRLPAVICEATIANLVGNKVVEKAVEGGFVEKDKIIEIAGVKHAQVIVI